MKTETYKGWEIKLLYSYIRCKNLKTGQTLTQWFHPTRPITQWRKYGKGMVDSFLGNQVLRAKERVIDILSPFKPEARKRIVKVASAKLEVYNILKPFRPESRKRILQFIHSSLTGS